MKKFFRRLLKSLAYTSYFLTAFVFFVYLTLPMEEAIRHGTSAPAWAAHL